MYPDLNSYLQCAAWSSTDGDHESLQNFEFSTKAKEKMEQDLKQFVDLCNSKFSTNEIYQELEASQFAHDFWLTRERHGAGFWDRGLGELGEELTHLVNVLCMLIQSLQK
jgi:hypothetical protein